MFEKYINKNTKVLNKKGRDDLYDLYNKNEKFSGGLVNYIRSKLAWRDEQILDKRCNYFTLNKLSCEYLTKGFQSKDHPRNLIRILANYE